MCLNYNLTGNGAKVRVRNEFDDDLGYFFLTNTSYKTCTDIIPNYIQKESWIGVECTNCDSNTVLNIGKILSGDDTFITYYDGSNEFVGYDEPTGIELYFYKHCRRAIKIAFGYYFLILVACFGGSALFGGINAWSSIFKD